MRLRAIIIALAALLVFSAVLLGCSVAARGSGNLVTEELVLEGFWRIRSIHG
ncbi:hypothetical protein ACFLTW_01160 [Chloroflexota bacterium]